VIVLSEPTCCLERKCFIFRDTNVARRFVIAPIVIIESLMASIAENVNQMGPCFFVIQQMKGP
jgi:hypothetical protein